MYLDLQKKLGYKFKDIALLDRALTHKSVSSKLNYEHLEFLGDHVLGLIISKSLLDKYPEHNVGKISRHYNSCVSESCLQEIGSELGLINSIKATKDILYGKSDSVVADVCEAIIGAIFIDSDYQTVGKVVSKLWANRINYSNLNKSDPKSTLQEWTQKHSLGLPIYKLIDTQGADHNPMFVVEVFVNGFDPISGNGERKQIAELRAAENFMKIIKRDKR